MESARVSVGSLLITLAVILIAAAGFVSAVRAVRGPTPQRLAEVGSLPVEATQHDGAWYWIERPKKGKARLVLAAASGVKVVASADAISGYDVDGGRVVWSARDGSQWSVTLADTNTSRRTVWTGAEAAGRPCFGAGRVLWSIVRPGLLRGVSPVAALGASVQVMSADADNRASPVAALPESEARVLGAHSGQVYVSAVRRDRPQTTAIYAVPLAGGPPRRLAAEQGAYPAVLRSDGILVWSGRSRDSSNPTVDCVRSFGSGGPAVTDADWLPPVDGIFGVGSATYYVDAGGQPAVWRVRTSAELASRIAPPTGFDPVAVGDRDILLRRVQSPDLPQQLYVVPRP